MPSSPQPAATSAVSESEDTQRHRQALNELIDMGMDLARMIHAQARAQTAAPQPEPAPNANTPAPAPTPDPTPAFDRIARCVRRTILLARHLAEAPHPPRPDPAQIRTAARRRILREVEDSIGHIATFKRLDTAALHRELLDRLDTPDMDDDIAARPIPDIIADIRRDLGLHDQPGFHPHQRRTPDDIARLHARAAGHRVPGPPPSAAPARRPPPAEPSAPTPKPPPDPGGHPPPDLMALANTLLQASPCPG